MKYDYGTLRYGLNEISNYNGRIYGNKKTLDGEKKRISKCILDHLTRIGKLAVNMNDDDATTQVILSIQMNGHYSIEREFNMEVLDVIFSLKEIGKLAAEKDLFSATIASLSALQDIGANRRKLEFIFDNSLSALDEIEEYATDERIIEKISFTRWSIEFHKEFDEEDNDE